MIKPKAERIDPYSPRREIIYRCSKCNTSFAILGQQIKYCYGCGVKIDWNVKIRLNDDFTWLWATSGTKLDCDSYETIFIKELNRKQLKNDF